MAQVGQAKTASLPLGGSVDLERLSPPGIRAFLNLAEAWGLSVEEQMLLLGGVSKSTFRRWKRSREASLSIDQLERISHLLGIHKSLQILLPTTGNRWVRRANDNLIFGGYAPLEVMLAGGINRLRDVRNLLEAQCGGCRA